MEATEAVNIIKLVSSAAGREVRKGRAGQKVPLPGGEYLNDPETVKSWNFGLTTVEWRKKDLKERLEKSNRLLHGEEGILLIKALCGLERVVSNVNIPNTALQM